MNISHSVWVAFLCLLSTSFVYGQCSIGNPSVNLDSWNFSLSIDGNFNAARRQEETNRGLTPGCLGNMMPPSGGFASLTYSELVFFIHNSEREARGLLPLHGVEANLSAVAQAHSDWQMANDAFSHGGDPALGADETYTQCADCSNFLVGSSPFERMDQNAILVGQSEGRVENIGVLVSTGGFITYFAAISMHGFMYVDATESWGHRNGILSSYSNNWGAATDEGFIGVGVTFGSDYQICAFNCTNYTYGHILTVDYYDPQAGTSGYSFSALYSPLPIELLSFTAKNKEGEVVLNWSTANEKNSDYFELQRSNDGQHFETIAVIQAAGDSYEKQYYSYLDRNPGSGTQYYRLNEVDFDGQNDLSDIVSVFISKQFSFNAYPNPFTKSFTVEIQNTDRSPLSYKILNNLGQQVSGGVLTENEHRIYMDKLPSGVYTLVVYKNNRLYTKRIVKEYW